MENKTYDIGQLLKTKDGREIGNAIVTKAEWKEYQHYTGWFYTIRTDFGNTAYFMEKEIEDRFHINKGEICDPAEQIKDQLYKLTNLSGKTKSHYEDGNPNHTMINMKVVDGKMVYKGSATGRFNNDE